ncbi:hypothetical protein QCA50_011614 [Cerrena zonata]|uniref:Uncharacterized protein n=1 Tax=Cerrena zonata TaxID=2478898 RepID=A0AAW0FWG8_9APHY
MSKHAILTDPAFASTSFKWAKRNQPAATVNVPFIAENFSNRQRPAQVFHNLATYSTPHIACALCGVICGISHGPTRGRGVTVTHAAMHHRTAHPAPDTSQFFEPSTDAADFQIDDQGPKVRKRKV